jgi:hypothetical protein
MKPMEFVQQWLQKELEGGFVATSDVLIHYSGETSFLDLETREFLIQAGLPCSAAPCLGFEAAKTLPRIWELYSPGQWKDEEKLPLSAYRVLGTDGAGNPICLDEKTDEVFLLDHEDGFKTVTFVNSSVSKLAGCLLANNGQSNGNILKEDIEHIDLPALQEGSFWAIEVALLLGEEG